mmetsp:Transcript_11845/g.35087  ORF Transcript_11845/g.35087 Transcript_11845/m.35087 type:complete len:288 (+) Transcript_11845:248-1111(+)
MTGGRSARIRTRRRRKNQSSLAGDKGGTRLCRHQPRKVPAGSRRAGPGLRSGACGAASLVGPCRWQRGSTASGPGRGEAAAHSGQASAHRSLGAHRVHVVAAWVVAPACIRAASASGYGPDRRGANVRPPREARAEGSGHDERSGRGGRARLPFVAPRAQRAQALAAVSVPVRVVGRGGRTTRRRHRGDQGGPAVRDRAAALCRRRGCGSAPAVAGLEQAPRRREGTLTGHAPRRRPWALRGHGRERRRFARSPRGRRRDRQGVGPARACCRIAPGPAALGGTTAAP